MLHDPKYQFCEKSLELIGILETPTGFDGFKCPLHFVVVLENPYTIISSSSSSNFIYSVLALPVSVHKSYIS